MLITGSWEKDSQYYTSFVHPLILKHFGYSGRLYHRKDDNTARFWISDKKVIQQFVKYGLPIGPKTNTIKIPQNIMKNKKLSIACLRGVFNTGGCVYRRYSKQYKNHPKKYVNYAVIEFKVKSKVLLEQVKEILESVEIKTTSISKNKTDAYVLRITSQKDISEFMKVIILRKYHMERYKTIIKKEKLKLGPVAQPGNPFAHTKVLTEKSKERAPASISSKKLIG